MLRVEQHIAPHSELHIPPGDVELRLAPVLPVLQQRQHFRSHWPPAPRAAAWPDPSGSGAAEGVRGLQGCLPRSA